MVVCVLKHTPGVFVDYTDENETIYSGLEVEVFIFEKIFLLLNTRFAHNNLLNSNCRLSVAWHKL